MKAHKAAFPFKGSFSSAPKVAAPKAGRPKAPAPGGSRRSSSLPGTHGRKGMLADVVMVVFWGASIPGLMWLGVAGGF